MDEKLNVQIEKLPKRENANRSSKRLLFIVIGVLVVSTAAVVFLLRNKNRNLLEIPESPYKLTPQFVTSPAGATQTFTATYPLPGGWDSISDASFYIAGGGQDQWLHYHPVEKRFSLEGVKESCEAGQASTISSNFLALNCSASSASGPEAKPTVTFSLTPQPSFAGTEYRLAIIAFDQAKGSSGAVAGVWTVK